jgi:hypothetical protein
MLVLLILVTFVHYLSEHLDTSLLVNPIILVPSKSQVHLVVDAVIIVSVDDFTFAQNVGRGLNGESRGVLNFLTTLLFVYLSSYCLRS